MYERVVVVVFSAVDAEWGESYESEVDCEVSKNENDLFL